MSNLHLLFSKEDERKVKAINEFYEKYCKKEKTYDKYIDNIITLMVCFAFIISIFAGYKTLMMGYDVLATIVTFFVIALIFAVLMLIIFCITGLYFEHSLEKYRNISIQNEFAFYDIPKYIEEAKTIKDIRNILSLEKTKDAINTIIKWDYKKLDNSINIKIEFENKAGFIYEREYVLYPKSVEKNAKIKDAYYDFINLCLILPSPRNDKENFSLFAKSKIIIEEDKKIIYEDKVNIPKEIEQGEYICPNIKCGYIVEKEWNHCPYCSELLDWNKIKENTEEITTNMGKISKEDYKDIVAMQNGFDSYEDMVANGVYIDLDEKE